MWVPGLELRSSGLPASCLYSLSHISGPVQQVVRDQSVANFTQRVSVLTETSVFEQLLCLLSVVPVFAPNCLSVDVEHFMGVDTKSPRLPGQCHMASNKGSSLFPKESNSLNPAAPDFFL